MYWDNGKENGNYSSILGLYIGIMENEMETTRVYRDSIGYIMATLLLLQGLGFWVWEFRA